MNVGRRTLGLVVVLACTLATVWLFSCWKQPRTGEVLDEALANSRDTASFPAADEDYFHDLDGGIALTPDEVKGRDTWLVWSGGNDLFWDRIGTTSFGVLDFLKTISDYPYPPPKCYAAKCPPVDRLNRWKWLGLIREPCFDRATGPDPKRYGLWLEKRSPTCPPDPFENEQKYPGVRIGARGKTVEVGSYYGYATGIVGLRLFPNPAFDEKAKAHWDAVKYYTDRKYYESKDLVRPYRVGMTCAFCHIGPNPLKPPKDFDHPMWSNLSATVGAQNFWVDRIFSWSADPSNFFFQLFHTARPGTLDTSLVSTDSLNNPRTMNAIYLLGPRFEESKRWGKETLVGGNLDNKQFNDFVQSGPLTDYYQAPDTVWSPRVLKDASDSVGALGALNRVYINIGTFSEEWMLHFNPLVGGKQITPIQISVARRNSAYFAATENQTFDEALYLVKASGAHHLADAPGGMKYLTADAATITRGKIVFAETCARCHSSKLPPMAPGLDPNGCAGPAYLDCWNKYWAWTKTADFKSKMRPIVLSPDFLVNNYLSADFRVPVTLLHTYACSPLATNAIAGNIWDNFSSQTYKELPSVGDITWYDPYTGERHKYHMPGGGRGYTRPASLVSVWSTAPYLQNNSVGPFDEDLTVDARMKTFQASIEQILWPERREQDELLKGKIPGKIDRTTQQSFLTIASGYLPDPLQHLLAPSEQALPWLITERGIQIGPIPTGTPVDLLANLNPISDSTDAASVLKHDEKLVALLLRIKKDLKALPRGASDEQAKKVMANLVGPLLDLSKCPDFIVNRGHYFGTGFVEQGDPAPPDEPGLSDADKRALIEFLKTF